MVGVFGLRSGTHRSVHLCDIAVEQLGTGLHKPQAGVWSWLACDATPEGDVYVADCDNACVRYTSSSALLRTQRQVRSRTDQ